MTADDGFEAGFVRPASEPEAERFATRARVVGRALLRGREGDAIESPFARLADVAALVSKRIGERPLTSLALAVGAGFAIGGALSFRAGRFALSAAARHLGRALLKQVL